MNNRTNGYSDTEKIKKITTVTLSPALDVEYAVDEVDPLGLNRASGHRIGAGGKGINVSRAIRKCASLYGVSGATEAICALGGMTGRMIAEILSAEILSGEEMTVRAVETQAETRINISVIGGSGSMEINSPGTAVGDAIREVEAAVLEAASRGDVIAICGSCPKDVAKTYPSELCRKVKETGAVCVIDCDGEALRHAVFSDVPPDIIKPNVDELSALTGRKIDGTPEAIAAAESLPGNMTVITTMAGDGSIVTETVDGIRMSTFHPTKKQRVVRLKGAGDTFLGAFLYARYVGERSIHDAMAYASAVAGDYVSGEEK